MKLKWLAAVVVPTFAIQAMVKADAPTDVETRVDAIVAKMSQADKVTLLGGVQDFYTRPIDAAGLPRFKMSDGPIGARNDGKATAYPAGVLLAATWDPEIAQVEGVALGRDCRSRGDHFILGPAVNICRVPQNGRNFEYFGEDPYLAGKMAVGFIKGVQSQGVAACVKHYACNNQEIDRGSIDVKIDERTLHEIYLPAFEAAVKEGHVRSIMAAYNRVNGDFCSASPMLLTDVLRTQWHFDGVAMSDWGAVHDTKGPLVAGLDLEMPGPEFLSPKKVAPLIADGTVTDAMLDVRLKRLVRVGVELGWFDRAQKDTSIPADDETSNEAALKVAREGIVMLKNNGILPLPKSAGKKIVVLGAGGRYVHGGGSSEVNPAKPTTLAQGLEKITGPGSVTLFPSTFSLTNMSAFASASKYEPAAEGEPLHCQFFDNQELKGNAVVDRRESKIDHDWKKNLPDPAVKSESFSVRWTGKIKPPATGSYIFATRSDDGSRILLDGKVIIDCWRDQAATTEQTLIDLEAGKTYELTVEYYNAKLDASMRFGWGPSPATFTDEQAAAIKTADAVVIEVATGESEGGDRRFDLNGEDVALLTAAEKLSDKVIVVLAAGGNVNMTPWLDKAAALVDVWYPGQAGGQATAEILFGDVNPSGHLPDTFFEKWEQYPAFGNYPGDHKSVDYAEGLNVGYRAVNDKKPAPKLCFGYGLSYTTFDIKNPQLTMSDAGGVAVCDVTVDVTNTGKTEGATVVQLYIEPPANSAIPRPARELKAFARIELQPGQTAPAHLSVDRRSFAYWDVAKHDWTVAPGSYRLMVGENSRDLKEAGVIVQH